MDEYISRDDVLKKAKSSISVPTDNEWDCGYNTAMAEMQEFIKQLPSADVQPVKRGKWEFEHYDELIECYVANCSECGYESTDKYRITSNHRCCENCGARMDLKDGDAEWKL